jgi:hypothetical protein
VQHSLPAGNQSSVRFAVKTLSLITNTRTTYLSNSLDVKEGNFLSKRKMVAVKYLAPSAIKQRWHSIISIPLLKLFPLILEAAPTLL